MRSALGVVGSGNKTIYTDWLSGTSNCTSPTLVLVYTETIALSGKG